MAFTAWPDLWDVALGEGTSAAARATLFRVHAELFVGAPARDLETIRAFEAIALGFLPRLDRDALVAMAALLAPCPDTPPAVIDFLSARCPETRAVVVPRAPALSSIAVDGLIGSAEGRRLLALRPDLDPRTVMRLLVLHDPALDVALAGNPSFGPADAAAAPLLARARTDGALARALLRRADLPLVDEAALYLFADEARRRLIRARMAASAAYQRRPLGFRASGGLTRRLVDSALAGDVAAFEGHLSAGLGLPAATEWRFLAAGRDELLALGLLALAVDEEEAVRIALTLHPAISHSVAAVGALARTLRAVPRPIALALVEAILDAPMRQERAGRHAPLHEGAERAGAPAAARPNRAAGGARATLPDGRGAGGEGGAARG